MLWLAFLAVASSPATAAPAPVLDPVTREIMAVGETSTQIAFEVDPKGKVTDCRILVPSLSPKLDQRACEIVQEKGKFGPWRGPEKGKIRKFSTRILWKIEE